MASEFKYDDSNLQRLFAELEPKRRAQALRPGFRKAAANVRKQAIVNLRKKVNSSSDLEKGVRALVFKRKVGFRITVGTKKANKNGKGESGYYISRRFREKQDATGKPVLIWAEKGTDRRNTKSNGGKRVMRLRSGHYTGRMPRYGFLAEAQSYVRGTVTEDTRRSIIENVNRIARKYGCK